MYNNVIICWEINKTKSFDSFSIFTIMLPLLFCLLTFRYLYTLSVPHTIITIDLTPDKPSKKQLGKFKR